MITSTCVGQARGRERTRQGSGMSQRGPGVQRSPIDGGAEAHNKCELHHELVSLSWSGSVGGESAFMEGGRWNFSSTTTRL